MKFENKIKIHYKKTRVLFLIIFIIDLGGKQILIFNIIISKEEKKRKKITFAIKNFDFWLNF